MKAILLVLMLCGVAEANVAVQAGPVAVNVGPYPYYYQPPQPGVYYLPYYRPTWVGNFLFGPVYVPFVQQPQQPQPQPVQPVQ